MHNLLNTTFLLFALAASNAIAAQPPKKSPGPVVSAYLTSLAEEFRELEFQISHREISRADYERTRQRLLLLRSLVEGRAASNKEDRVPELQVLLADEFDRLGLSARPEAGKLRSGAELENQWKLISIERDQKSGRRFFVFERLTTQQSPGGKGEEEQIILPARKITVLPERIIETITVPEDEFWLRMRKNAPAEPPTRPTAPETNISAPVAPPAPANGSASGPLVTEPPTASSALPTRTNSIPAPTPAPAQPAPTVAAPAAAGPTPRIITLYTPGYTVEARGDNIEGEVILSALFCRDGWIREIEVVKGLGHGLDERAISAIKRTMFEAALQNGQAIDARAQVLYRFTLDKVTAEVLKSEPVKGKQP
jgi:protein TonB